MIYHFLKQLIKLSIFFFFKKIVVTGKEHIPAQGPLILAVNHPNTFMDPLLVASICTQRIGFIANAGIFLNDFVTRIFSYFHVIPIFRKKDIQPGEKPDNRMAFMKCHEYLSGKGTILIFPEGTSYYELKLREIKTGTARIALSFEELNHFRGNLKIVPIALDYSDSIQFRSVVSIRVCPPLSVSDYKKAYEKDEFETVLQLTEAIRKELAKNIPQTSGKEQEEFLVRMHHFYTSFYDPQAALHMNPKLSLELRNQVSKALHFLEKHNVELYLDTQKKVAQFFKLLKEEGVRPLIISNNIIEKNKPIVYGSYFLKFILLFPVYILGLVFNYIPFMLPVKIFRALKLDIEYKAPVQMIAGLITFPLFYALILWLFRVYVSPNIWYSLLLLLVMPLTGFACMYYYAEAKRFSKLMHYNFFMAEDTRQKIEMLRGQILKNVEEAIKSLDRVSSDQERDR
jgi:1-acyl-sn-glycerol-3-phosphate acyltransferase